MHEAVTFKPAHAGKAGTCQAHMEVGFPVRAGGGMPGVAVALVAQIDVGWREIGLQFSHDAVTDGHNVMDTNL